MINYVTYDTMIYFLMFLVNDNCTWHCITAIGVLQYHKILRRESRMGVGGWLSATILLHSSKKRIRGPTC